MSCHSRAVTHELSQVSELESELTKSAAREAQLQRSLEVTGVTLISHCHSTLSWLCRRSSCRLRLVVHRESSFSAGLQAAESEDGARWQAAKFEGNDVAYFCGTYDFCTVQSSQGLCAGLMEKMAKRQDALMARTAAMQVS